MTWRQKKHKKRRLSEENEVVCEIRVDFWFLQSSTTNSIDSGSAEGWSAKVRVFFQGGEGGNQHLTSEEKCLKHLNPAPPIDAWLKRMTTEGQLSRTSVGEAKRYFRWASQGEPFLGSKGETGSTNYLLT